MKLIRILPRTSTRNKQIRTANHSPSKESIKTQRPFLVSNTHRVRDMISRKESFSNSITSQLPSIRARQHKRIEYFRPTNPSIELINRKQYLNAENSLEMFINKANTRQLNVLQNYFKHNAIIRRSYLTRGNSIEERKHYK